jgi:subtilisin family serine protease
MTSLEAYVSRTWLDGQLTQVTFGEDIEIANAIERFRALPEVEYAIVDSLFSLAEVIPNDPHFEDQWSLKNDVGPDINATFAWDQSVGQSTTLVAVLDSGVDYTHPDLYLAIAVNQDEISPAFAGSLIDTNGDGLIDFYDLNSLDAFGQLVVDGSGAKYNASFVTDANGNSYIDAGDLMLAPWSDGVDGDGNGLIDDLTGWDHITNTKNPTDSTGHGTHVTGIIAARGDNSEGIAGVNWNARILPEKVVKDGVVKTSDAIDAIQRAVAAGADVINASWGSYIYDPALRDAIEWAGLHGVVFVAAAGNHLNDNDNPAHAYYPASYDLPNVISVASSDPNGNLSDFSNYGDNTVDLVAPGSNVLSTWLGGSYATHSGTSMAAPHVAGVVSLLGGLFPDASTSWLVDRVLSTVDLLPGLSAVTITGGILDAFVAVNTTSVAGPRVVASEPTGDVVSEAPRVVIRFDRPMDLNTFTPDDVELSGPSGPIAVTAINWLNDFEFEVTFVPQMALGVYSLHLGPSISDQVGRPMDQDRDGLAGELIDDRYAATFRIIPPPQVQTIDSGEAGFSATGGWVNYNGAGLDGDMHFIQAGSGSETATWSFTGLAPGKYRVAVTWEEYSNRVSNAAYTVQDDFAELATLVVDQRQAPSSFFADGVWWQDVSGEFDILGGILSVQLTNLAAPADGYLIADAVRVERVGDASLPPGPEVRVLEGAASITDETGTVDFGRADIGTPVSRTFTVRNAGSENLTLGSISLPEGFSLAADFTTTTLASGQQTTFTVRLDAVAAGVFGGQVSFATNDDDENPFNFTVQGTVSVLLTIDSGEAGFSATGGWVNYNGAGLDGDMHFIQAGSGSETATWSFTGLAPGKYRVAVTWEEYSNRVSNAAYTVQDDFAELATLVVDQRQAPSSFFADGVWWQDVSGEFDILGGILSVQLTNLAAPADGYLIADAVRVERVGDASPT